MILRIRFAVLRRVADWLSLFIFSTSREIFSNFFKSSSLIDYLHVSLSPAPEPRVQVFEFADRPELSPVWHLHRTWNSIQCCGQAFDFYNQFFFLVLFPANEGCPYVSKVFVSVIHFQAERLRFVSSAPPVLLEPVGRSSLANLRHREAQELSLHAGNSGLLPRSSRSHPSGLAE